MKNKCDFQVINWKYRYKCEYCNKYTRSEKGVKACFLCTLRNNSTIYKDLETNDILEQWIKGVFENNCSFVISKFYANSKKYYRFEFNIIASPEILKEIRNYFGCGRVQLRSSKYPKLGYIWRINQLYDIVNRMLPFFDNHLFLNHDKQLKYKNFRTKCKQKYEERIRRQL